MITLTHSPSSLALARNCKRSWALRYLYKIYPEDSYTRGKTLGTLIHRCLELYLRGGKLTDLTYENLGDGRRDVNGYYAQRIKEHATLAAKRGEVVTQAECETRAAQDIATLFKEAPQRALAGLDYLPKPANVYWHDVESKATILSTLGDLRPEVIPHEFSDRSRIDWVGTVRNEPGVPYEGVLIIDHKSTAGKKDGPDKGPWAYVPKPEDLLADPQFCIYAVSVMQRMKNVKSVVFRWIYYYTGDGPAQATKVEVTATWEHCARMMRETWIPLCDELQALTDQHNKQPINIGELPPPADLTSDQAPCKKYRGCPHKGVRCEPPVIPLSQLVANFKAPQPEPKEDTPMTQPVSIANMLAGSLPVQPTQPLHVAPPGYSHAAPAPTAPPPFYPQTPVAPMMPAAVAAPAQPYVQPLPAADVVVGGSVAYSPAQGAMPYTPSFTPDAITAPALPPAPEPAAEKPKRTRRTKAEVEAAVAAGNANPVLVAAGVPDEMQYGGAATAIANADNFGTEGTVPTLHTADPLEALIWALRNSGGKITVTLEVGK